MKPRFLNQFKVLTVCITPAIAALTAPSAKAATRLWDGGAATNILDTPANWSDDQVPSAAGDVAQWNGSVAGPLSLTSTGAWTATSGNGGGTSVSVTSLQTSSLVISPTQNFGVGATIDVESGAGPVTISPTANMVFRGGNATITNASSNPLTFGSSIGNWNNGGGTERTVTFGGAGNIQIDGNFVLGGAGNFTTVTKTGAGTLTFNGAQNGGLTGVGNAMASLVINQGTMKFGNAARIATGGTLGTFSSAIAVSGILDWSSSATQTLSGIISGNGAINQTAGNLTLTGANTFNGTTTITGGALAVGGAGSLESSITVNGANAKYLHNSTTASAQNIALTQGTVGGTGTISAVTVANNAGATIANGNANSAPLTIDTLTFNGAGAISITEDGDNSTFGLLVTGPLTTTPASGQVTINASNPFWNSGTTYALVSAGTFGGALSNFTKGTISGLTSRQSSSLVLNGTTVGLLIGGDSPRWSGLDNSNWVVGTTGANGNWRLINGNVKTDYLQGDVVLFNDSATNTTATISAANVSPAFVNFDNSNKNYIINGAFGIAAGTVNKTGSGNVTISTPNTYAGGTNITHGTITLSGAGTLGATSGVLNMADATLNLGGTSQTVGPVAITGESVIQNGTLTATGLAVSTTFGTTAISAGLNLGSGNLDKSGDSTLALSGPTTYSGTTTISGGILALSGPASLGSTSSVALSGGSLDLGTVSQSTGTVTISAASTAGETISNGSLTPTAFNVTSTSGIATVSANILGTTGITVSGGGGNLGLSGNNTFTGALNLTSNVTVTIDGGSNTGGGAITYNSFGTTITLNSGSYSTSGITTSGLSEFRSLNLNGGTLVPAGNVFADTTAISININGGTVKSGNAAGISLFDYNNLVEVNALGATFDTTTGNITVGNNSTMFATGNVVIPTLNTPRVNGTAGGAVILLGGNSLIAGFTSNGVLDIQNNSTWNLNGIASSVEGLTGNGTVTNSVAPAVLTLNTNTGPHTYSGIIAGGANISVVKQGTGTQTLSGNNTYTGDTSVLGGVLDVTGNAIPDAGKLVLNGGVVNVTGTEVVGSLYFGAALQATGTWGATGSGAAHIDDTRFTGPGKIQVGGAAAGYASWAAAKGLSAGVLDGTSQDPDFDGISNLLEYVLGGLPIGTGSANTSILPVETIDATNITLTFKRPDLSEADTTQVVQISTDLGTWTDFATVGATTAALVTVTEDSPTADLDTVSVVIPRAGNAVNGKLFARLRAVKQP